MRRQRKGSTPIDAGPDEIHFDEEALDEAGSTGAIPEMFRKMMGLGLSGFFNTEAAIRGALGDTVPREWVEFVSEQSERTREEFARKMAEEFGKVLANVDLVELAGQLLEGRTVEVKAEFKLGPRDEKRTEAKARKGRST